MRNLKILGRAKTPFLRSGIMLGVEFFLILDMVVIHQLLRLHGVLFSNYFEYGVLSVSVLLATKSLLTRKWNFHDYTIRYGTFIGIGGTLFLDVLLVDQVLKLHTVNYPASINIGSGIIGLVLATVGFYGLRSSSRSVST